MANIDETKRAEARRAREQVETVQRVTEDVADTLRAGVEGAQTMAQAMQEAVANSFGAFSEVARRATGQTMPVLGRPGGEAGADGGGCAQSAGGGAIQHRPGPGLQDVSREIVERSQQRLQRNLDGLQALARCRSMTDFIEVQSSLLRDNLEQTLENSRRMAELTIQMADEATKTVTAQVEKTAQRLNRARRRAALLK